MENLQTNWYFTNHPEDIDQHLDPAHGNQEDNQQTSPFNLRMRPKMGMSTEDQTPWSRQFECGECVSCITRPKKDGQAAVQPDQPDQAELDGITRIFNEKHAR